MVTNLVLKLLQFIIVFVLGLLPHLAPPDWLLSVGDALATVSGALSGSSAWVPWSVLLLAIALMLASYGIAVAVRGLRIVASFVTLGGGS